MADLRVEGSRHRMAVRGRYLHVLLGDSAVSHGLSQHLDGGLRVLSVLSLQSVGRAHVHLPLRRSASTSLKYFLARRTKTAQLAPRSDQSSTWRL